MNHPQQRRLYDSALKSLATLALLGCTASIGLAQAAPPPPNGESAQAPPPGGPDQGPPRGGPGMQMPPRGGPGMRGGPGGPGMGGPGPRPERRQPAVDLAGTVDGLNYSPRGDVDAVMLKMSEKTAQINLPPGLGLALSQVSAGSNVKVTAYPEPGQADHPVYELASLTTEQGKKITAPGAGDEKFVHEEGTIKRLNYARHGEVDGAMLDNGDLVSVGPAAAELKLSIGQKIVVDGPAHPMLGSDHNAIHAVAIDGKMLHQGPPPGGGPDGPGRRGRRGPGGRGGPDGRHGPEGGPGPQGGPGDEAPDGRPDAPQPPREGRADDRQPGLGRPLSDAPQQ